MIGAAWHFGCAETQTGNFLPDQGIDPHADAGANRANLDHRADIVSAVIQDSPRVQKTSPDATAAPAPIKAPFSSESDWRTVAPDGVDV